jgi:hypothetical protein
MPRGRKSAASLAVVKGSFGERPEPPADLTPEQAVIWRETAASEPVDFFNTAALRALLGDYCRHRASADVVSAAINTFKPEWVKASEGAKRYHDLLRMRDLETSAAMRAATKLRLTNQSRYTPQAAATASRNSPSAPMKPWEKYA